MLHSVMRASHARSRTIPITYPSFSPSAKASVGWAKRSVPTADLQSSLTLTWARRYALLPTLRSLWHRRMVVMFQPPPTKLLASTRQD
jgi:hypothetical protein